MRRVICGTLLILALLAGAAGAAAQDKPAAGKAASAATLVNLNTATKAEIVGLPGVGEKTAQLILEYREKNGGFKKAEELMNVKGIGEKTFLKLQPLVTVGEPKTAVKQ